MPPNNPPQNNPFITGHLAMIVTGNWHINTMRIYAPDVDYDITYIPIPNVGDKPSTWAGGWALVVPTGSRRKEAAVAFIHYMGGEPGQRLYARDSGRTNLHSLEKDETVFTPRQRYFQYALSFTKSRPPLPVGALYWDALSFAQDMVVQNARTPMEALQQAEQQVQPQLNRFLPLR